MQMIQLYQEYLTVMILYGESFVSLKWKILSLPFPRGEFSVHIWKKGKQAQPSPSNKHLPVRAWGDGPRFIWFKGSLFSTLNRFMAFPSTDVRAASSLLSTRFTAIKVIRLALCCSKSAHNYCTHTTNEHSRGCGTSVGKTLSVQAVFLGKRCWCVDRCESASSVFRLGGGSEIDF